ncbi:MAG: carboxypeptidase regulatory-like domain-containing protein [Acidobacteriaceae bacterium]
MRKLPLALLLLVSVIAMMPVPGTAQVNTGQVTGVVSDTSGAVISGATVTLQSTATGAKRTVQSNGQGSFLVPGLTPGIYSVVVTATGFGSYTASAAVTVGGFLTVDAKLGVEATRQIVLVSGADVGAEVDTTSQELSQVVTPLQVTQLPSLTRDPYDFVGLSGGVSGDPNGSTGRGVGVSFSGTRSSSTEVLLDGVENVDLFSQSVGVTVPLDSVQEYRVITSGFTAEYGRASGGIVDLITKSGSNSYHGSLYEYNRISALASNTFYEDAHDSLGNTQPSDHFTQNQFGYSVGGRLLPWVHDKLFFFSNTEWNRIRSSGNALFLVPSSSFIASSAANTQAYFAQYGKLGSGVTTGPTVDGGALQEVTVTAPINAGAGDPINAWFSFDRVDYNPTDKTNMFFKYDGYKDNIFAGTNSLSPYNGFNTGSTDFDQAILASVNHVFSPNLISNTKMTYTRLNGGQPLGSAGTVPGMYLYATNGASTDTDGGTGLPIVMPGYLPTSPGNAIPFEGPQNFYQVEENMTWTKGRQSFLFGGSYIQVRDNRTFGAYLNAVEQIGPPGGSDPEATGLAALAAGDLYQYQVAVNPGGKYPCAVNSTPTPSCEVVLPVGPPDFTHENTFNDGNWYVQDAWKINPKFTLTLGLRWEYYGVQHNTKPELDSNFYEGSGSNIFEQIRNGSVMPAPQSPVHGLYAKRPNNYGPRIGFAYDVFGDGKTAIRGGFALAYERNFGNVTYNTLFNPPYFAIPDIYSNEGGFGQLSISTANYGPISGSSGSQPIPPAELRALDPHLPTAYDYQYDLAVEHEIGHNVLGSIEYTGTRGIHLYSIANINKDYSGNVYLGDPMTGDTVGDPLNLQYGSINVREANADSYYNGLNFKLVDNNYTRYGLQMTANYTLAHALDDLSTTFSESNNSFNLGYTNPFDPGLDRGNSDYDVRNRVVVSGIYQPNYLEFRSNPIAHTLLGGMEFAPIFTWRTGTPFTVYDCSFALYSCDRINAVPGLQYHGHPIDLGGGQYQYAVLPPAAHNTYQDPIVGVDDFPTAGPNGFYQNVGQGKDQFYDPDNWNLDFGAYKNFSVREHYNIQLRSEFYNILNHHNLYANAYSSYYSYNSSDPSADQYVDALKGTANGYSPGSGDERRNVQLALRFEF